MSADVEGIRARLDALDQAWAAVEQRQRPLKAHQAEYGAQRRRIEAHAPSDLRALLDALAAVEAERDRLAAANVRYERFLRRCLNNADFALRNGMSMTEGKRISALRDILDSCLQALEESEL